MSGTESRGVARHGEMDAVDRRRGGDRHGEEEARQARRRFRPSRAYPSERTNCSASAAGDGEINIVVLFVCVDPPPSNLAIPFSCTSRPREEERAERNKKMYGNFENDIGI